LLTILLSFLLLLNWFLFLSSFVFPLLFRHCFIPVSLAHVVSSLAYPNLLGTKRLGCCCCCCTHVWFLSVEPAGKLALQMQVELLHYRGRVYTPKASLQRFVGTNDSKIGIVSVFKTDR
jgi:hypothetical protein